MKAQRDEFLELLLQQAKKDNSIFLLSADMGAPSIDIWKEQLPSQYFPMGISEQNAINVAAGLSRGGKKVFVYFMAVWIHRCFEQIRYSSSIAGNKITIIGNGVGLGYAPAGPAHEPNEDVAIMRTLHNMNVYSASSVRQMKGLLNQCFASTNSNYVRLERKIYKSAEDSFNIFEDGFFQPSYEFSNGSQNEILAIIVYGQVTRRIHELKQEHPELFQSIKIIEISKIWPLDFDYLEKQLGGIKSIILVEEQSRSGSISEAVSFELARRKVKDVNIESIHLPDKYVFENGNQDELLDRLGFSREDLLRKIQTALEVSW